MLGGGNPVFVSIVEVLLVKTTLYSSRSCNHLPVMLSVPYAPSKAQLERRGREEVALIPLINFRQIRGTVTVSIAKTTYQSYFLADEYYFH